MNKYQDNELKFDYPIDWVVEKDTDTIAVFNPSKGVGALQFSIYTVPNPKNASMREILADYTKGRHDHVEIFDKKSYVSSNYVEGEGGTCWKYFLCLKNTIATFATYNCDKKDI